MLMPPSSAARRRLEQRRSLRGTVPLNGIRVFDLSRVLSGTYCTLTHGDLGAEVIEINRLKAMKCVIGIAVER